MIIFHIVTENEWNNFNQSQYYEGKTLKTDGFLHCCTFDQILHVANNNLKDINEKMLVICINTEYLSNELKWEQNPKNNMTFPHLYGPINSDAIISTVSLDKNSKGEFYISDELHNYKAMEKSCGAIVVHKFKDTYKTLLIGFLHGGKINWGFPKGHVEKDETEHQTALREIKEETGLDVEIMPNFRRNTYFSCKKGITLEVVCFGAISNTDKVTCQEGEVEKYIWCDLENACDHLTFKSDKIIFNKFKNFFGKQK